MAQYGREESDAVWRAMEAGAKAAGFMADPVRFTYMESWTPPRRCMVPRHNRGGHPTAGLCEASACRLQAGSVGPPLLRRQFRARLCRPTHP
eukprot:1053402-Prymnesium_polylepis.1